MVACAGGLEAGMTEIEGEVKRTRQGKAGQGKVARLTEELSRVFVSDLREMCICWRVRRDENEGRTGGIDSST